MSEDRQPQDEAFRVTFTAHQAEKDAHAQTRLHLADAYDLLYVLVRDLGSKCQLNALGECLTHSGYPAPCPVAAARDLLGLGWEYDA